jgi:hypothetical protein
VREIVIKKLNRKKEVVTTGFSAGLLMGFNWVMY